MAKASRGETIGGRYSLGALLGRGGSGAVFSAQRLETGETVAIKLLSAGIDAARLRREIAALQVLRFPGVVRFIDSGEHEGRPYIVMEQIDGAPWPGPTGRSWEQLREPTLRLLEVLARIHQAGVVHRDLKPGNVLVCDDGRVVVLDFGLARGSLLGSTITATGAMMGTPHYLAPEQLAGKRVDSRADLYALGVMLFEALTGQPPHPAGDLNQLWQQRMLQAPPSLASLSPKAPQAVIDTVMRCLQREPAQRPWGAGDVRQQLEGVQRQYLPKRLGADLVPAVQRRLQESDTVDIWGPPGSGRSRLLEDVARTWEGAVVWLHEASRPFESMHALVGSLSGKGDAAQVRAHVEATLETFDGLLIADDFSRLDRASRRLLQRRRPRLLRVQSSPTALQTAPLTHADLRALFHGPERLLHLPEDGAGEVLRRTDGVAARVEALMRGWERAGHIRRDGDRFRIERQTLDRLQAERNPSQLIPPQGEVPADLLPLARLVSFAHPHTTTPALAALTEREAWELELELEDLVELGAIRQEGAHWRPRWELEAPMWSEQREQALHRQLSALLPEGTPGRLEHLILGDQPQLAQQEAVASSHHLERIGQAGAAIEVLLSAAALTAAPPQALWDRLIVLVVNRGDAAACRGALQALAPHTQPAHTGILQAWSALRAGDLPACAAALAATPEPPPPVRLALETARFRLAQRHGLDAERRFLDTLSDLPEDKRLTWQGLHWYRSGEMVRAAASHEAALLHRREGSGRMSSLLNAASSWLEAGELERAAARAAEGLDLAREARHTQHEARAEWILRAICNRQGGTEPDLELAAAATALRGSMLSGILLCTETYIAWRGQHIDDARRLAAQALAVFTAHKAEAAMLHMQALLCATGTGPGEDIARQALQLHSQAIALDILGMLASYGKLTPALAAQATQSLEAAQSSPLIGFLQPAVAYPLILDVADVVP